MNDNYILEILMFTFFNREVKYVPRLELLAFYRMKIVGQSLGGL